MRVVGILVQARISSTRLPGKVFKKLVGQKSMLEIVVERLEECRLADLTIVCTSTNPADKEIVDWCLQKNTLVMTGDENKVLYRFADISKKMDLDVIVRITSDCPAIDPDLVDRMIQMYMDNDYDYVSNIMERDFPRGMDVEVFSAKALETAIQNATTDIELEHVTPYIYGHPELFKLGSYRSGLSEKFNQYRLTVDTPEDLDLARKVFKELYPRNPLFSWRELVRLFQMHPEWDCLDQNKQSKYQSSKYFNEHKESKENKESK